MNSKPVAWIEAKFEIHHDEISRKTEIHHDGIGRGIEIHHDGIKGKPK
jgi:hypothetical protein